MPTLIDQVVLVTGANGGLGTEFVSQALDHGARKVYAAARSPREHSDPRVVALPLDVTSAASIAAAVRVAPDLTVLVNNAGVGGGHCLLTEPLAAVRQVYETNVFGPIALAQAFASTLAGNGGGAMVNVLSALSWLATPGAYAGTKAALWSATNTLRLELRHQHTHVLGAHLGPADTPLTADLDVPKSAPADVVGIIYAALREGRYEVLVDDTARQVRLTLSRPLIALYPELDQPAGPDVAPPAAKG